MSDEQFIPGRRCKHGHETMKKYPSGAVTCLTCARGNRETREKALREGKKPPGKPRRTKQQMREVKMTIAAAAGAGMTPAAIAKQVGMNADGVEQVLRKDVKNDAELQALFREAERTLAPKALQAAEKLIDHIGKVAEGYDIVVGRDKEGNAIVQHIDTPPQHAAAALREMRPFIGMGDRQAADGGDGGVGKALALAMHKPEVARAVTEAILASREKRRLAAAEGSA